MKCTAKNKHVDKYHSRQVCRKNIHFKKNFKMKNFVYTST